MEGDSLWRFFWNARPAIKLKLSLLVLLAGGVLLGSAWAVLQVVQAQRLADRAAAAWEGLRAFRGKATPALTYELRGLSIHLGDRRHVRSAYAQFSLLLDCPNPAAQHAMELNHAKLLDAVFQTANAFYLEDFNSRAGLEDFKARLQAALEQRFQSLAPRQIWLKDWLVN